MAQYDLGPNGGALSFCLSVSVFQLENANPNSLNSDKKKEVSHVLALRVQTELRPLARQLCVVWIIQKKTKNPNPNSLNSDKKKKENHVLTY